MDAGFAQDALDVGKEDRRDRTRRFAVDPEHGDVAVAIDDEAGRAIAFAVEESVGGRRAVGEELLAKRERADESLREHRARRGRVSGPTPQTRSAIGESGS